MQIVIVGGGTVGSELAAHLQRSGHDVAMVEPRTERCAELAEKLDILVVEGGGGSPRALERAGIAQAQMIIAVSSVDEVNILSCGLAAQYGVPTRLARIRSGEYLDKRNPVDLAALGVTRIIDPEHILVRVIAQIARIPDAVEVFSYHEGEILIARHIMRDGMPILGKHFAEVAALAGEDRFLAVALHRASEGKTWIPAGDDTIIVGDDITTTFTRASLPRYLELLGLEHRRAKRAVVAGDGLSAIHLCRELNTWVDVVTLVDWDPDHALRAAQQLEDVEVISGDPTERDVLREVAAGRADLFVGVGNDTNRNVMGALLARSEGCREVIAVTLEPTSNRLFREIGVNHVVSPRRAIAHEIMDIIARGRVSVELQLRDLDLESVEIRVGAGSKVTRAPLSKIWAAHRRQAIVGAVYRHGRATVPGGGTVLEAGDEAVVILKPKHLRTVEDLFRERA
ncbi:MAG: Trk system potassium transporter TrkA [Candidatus Latescibacteria bacterium]|nr:Trk system potassium transporter TrkA [Candidatus Latescibacterota bacterium]